MNLKNRGKVKIIILKLGNVNNQVNSGNQQTPEMIMPNSGNQNMLLATGTMGTNNRLNNMENNSGNYPNQNIQNTLSKKSFYKI